MKNKTITLLLSLGLAHSVTAQLYTTGFESGVPAEFTAVPVPDPSDVTVKPDNSGIAGDYINFYTAAAPTAPTGFEQRFLNYTGTAPSNTQDFATSLYVGNFASSLTAATGSFAQIGLNINSADISNGVNLFNGAYSFLAGGTTPTGSSDLSFVTTTDSGTFRQALNFSQAAFVLADFSAASQTFTFSFATDLVTPVFTSFGTLNIDGTGATSGSNIVENWAMAPGELFDINIYAGSNVAIADQALGDGFLNVDSFGLNIVPEPSSYAAILGLVALMGVMVRRRRG